MFACRKEANGDVNAVEAEAEEVRTALGEEDGVADNGVAEDSVCDEDGCDGGGDDGGIELLTLTTGACAAWSACLESTFTDRLNG
jgi:hypothetical protein